MKKILLIFVLFFCLLFNTSASIRNKDTSYIVLESSTLRVLEGKDINKQMLIASTAKILTAITVIENYSLDEDVTINNNDVIAIGSKVYLKAGEKIKRKDLLYALMLRSANDAASALSFNNSKEFMLLMNETAKKIGMKDSVFENASGLDELEYNISTAYDMALLSAYAKKNEVFSVIASTHIHSCKTNLSSYNWVNKHKLVKSDDDFVWGKTGFTKSSGRILVSNYKKGDMDLIVVTINDSDDWNHHKMLINQLGKYSFITVLERGIYDSRLDVSYYIYVLEDIVIPISEKEKENIKLQFKLLDKYAYLYIYLNDKLICKRQLDIFDKSSFDVDLVIDLFKL